MLGATSIFYTPVIGRSVPLWDGVSAYAIQDIGGELSQALTDTTKSPAAAAASKNYDMFVWLDGAVPRCTRGPAWSTDIVRGTGAGTTELELVNGFYVNKYAIANGPAARRGLFVGSIRTNAAATLDWSTGSLATGGGTANLTVWNAYNQIELQATVQEAAASWSYASGTPRPLNNSANNRINMLCGLGVGGTEARLARGGAGGRGGFCC